MGSPVSHLAKKGLPVAILVSVGLHVSGFSLFADEVPDVQMSSSSGASLAVVGSLEDLVAGAEEEIEETIPEPVEEVREVKEVENTEPQEVTALEHTETPPVEPPVEVLPVDVASVEPLGEGITEVLATPVQVVAKETEPKQLKEVKREEVKREPVKEVKPEQVEPKKQEQVKEKEKPDQPSLVANVPKPAPARPIKKTTKKESKPAQKKGTAAVNNKRGNSTVKKVVGGRDAGGQGVGNASQDNYLGKAKRRVQRAAERSYPRKAKRRKIEGVTRVSFKVHRDGSITGLRLSQSSGKDILDQAALLAVKRAAPFPKFPAEIKSKVIPMRVPITFRIR
ncbi:energy transducer TonB [Flexibacterium corallicola]|uniref:energy transducer TonB n=1 Tax=Flexibacterium corallicola TaxID=3037259 RepID=UPI00286F4BBF|nr:energy transducer TonB [Pseudovibrio sp. M1P-2-3]